MGRSCSPCRLHCKGSAAYPEIAYMMHIRGSADQSNGDLIRFIVIVAGLILAEAKAKMRMKSWLQGQGSERIQGGETDAQLYAFSDR